MKNLKNVIKVCLAFFIVWSCTKDDFSSNEVLEQIEAPTNVSALVTVTQDNTGLVTITPIAVGATNFNVNFGDGSDLSESIAPGNSVEHTYPEGAYEIQVIAKTLNGLTTSATQNVLVSFQAPENLVVNIENDVAISKQVNVTATADFALSYEVDFGETGVEPIMGNIGETISHIYEEPGTYTITVTAFSAAIETLSYTEDFIVTAIVQPLASAPEPPARDPQDVVSVFTSAYTNLANANYFPDWGQGGQGSSWALFNLAGDDMLQYINLSYQGIELGENVDVSSMEYLHLDVWTADIVTDLETSLINNGVSGVTEAPVTNALSADQWISIEIPISDYVSQGLTVSEIFQLKFVGTPWAAGTVFIDNIYFYKEPSAPSDLAGTWKVAPEAGALAVGPTPGSSEWWSIDAAGVTQRACYFDDEYVFGSDGSFMNVLGADSWIEGWQGGGDACGAPVAPHDGSVPATYSHDAVAGTITLNGTGAFLGLAKANNAGELSSPAAAPGSITYNVTMQDANTMIIGIEAGSGVFWTYKLIRDGQTTASPLEGTWQMAPEAGSLGVGPALGDTSWWNCDAACVTERACYYDDQYVFGSDGSFTNVLGADSWIESWQGGGDACGAPVAPHDGSNPATFTYDASAETLTLNGVGAYIGLAKANNAGELSSPANAPSSIVYNITFLDANTINVSIEAGAGVFWQYKLTKI